VIGVSVRNVVKAARLRQLGLPGELAGYIVLGALDASRPNGLVVDCDTVTLGDDGRIHLEGNRSEAATDVEEFRKLLRLLLEVAVSAPPALLHVSTRLATGELGAFVSELQTALVPVNRAAARRRLARLYRDLKKLTLPDEDLGCESGDSRRPHRSSALASPEPSVERTYCASPSFEDVVAPALAVDAHPSSGSLLVLPPVAPSGDFAVQDGAASHQQLPSAGLSTADVTPELPMIPDLLLPSLPALPEVRAAGDLAIALVGDTSQRSDDGEGSHVAVEFTERLVAATTRVERTERLVLAPVRVEYTQRLPVISTPISKPAEGTLCLVPNNLGPSIELPLLQVAEDVPLVAVPPEPSIVLPLLRRRMPACEFLEDDRDSAEAETAMDAVIELHDNEIEYLLEDFDSDWVPALAAGNGARRDFEPNIPSTASGIAESRTSGHACAAIGVDGDQNEGSAGEFEFSPSPQISISVHAIAPPCGVLEVLAQPELDCALADAELGTSGGCAAPIALPCVTARRTTIYRSTMPSTIRRSDVGNLSKHLISHSNWTEPALCETLRQVADL
jgi:hypothetical protein